jgi:hypothetical protein
MIKEIIATIIDLKLHVETIRINFKNAKSVTQCIVVYIIATIIVFNFFLYFFFIFGPISLIIVAQGIVYIFLLKKKYNIKSVVFYEYGLKKHNFNAAKYYLYDIVIQYSFLVFYLALQLGQTKILYNLVYKLVTKIFNIVFICVFGFPVFFIKIINKLYTQIDNSIIKKKFNIRLCELNFESMFIFDFKGSIEYESLEIWYEDGTLKFK